jgi:hypothetical protein
MMVVVVECGSIDPSASNLCLLIKPTIHRCISSIQGVFVGLLLSWTVGHTPRVLMQGRRKSRRWTPTRILLYSC